tara:strand:- start:450 stop:1157 length:708 start_codon:yes stop_codon:yes gene_type:complete
MNFKLLIAGIYFILILLFLYFLLSAVDLKDLTSYEFIRLNKDIILKYKSENFLLLNIVFFIFTVIWILLLGFAMPLLLFAGFVFGKWWGIILVLTSTTIGAALLYLLAGFFLKEVIKEKLEKKFSKLKNIFEKNDILYFTIFRFAGGGGIPFAVQNVIPLLFNMRLKNYILGTFLGCAPSMFVTVSLGSGIENVIETNETLNMSSVLLSPEIYLPITGFVIILIIAFVVNKYYFK